MRRAADATIGNVEFNLLRDRGDSRVIVACVVKHEVANCTGFNTEMPQRLANNFSHPLATVSACQLRQRDRQVLEVTMTVDVVRNNA
jgi:hypothetical protein